jgi:hypothetical protein
MPRQCMRACATAGARAGSGQLQCEANADGTARGRGLSQCGCPSDVATTLYSCSHTVMRARQVASAQGRLRGDKCDNSSPRYARSRWCLKKETSRGWLPIRLRLVYEVIGPAPIGG